MGEYMKKKEELKRETTACTNLFRAAIADLKLGAAAKHLETVLSLLACCSVDIGKMGHGRNKFNDIIYCPKKIVDEKIKSWLSTPLPSTLLPPHYWVTADKATPSRTTNQAVLIIARSKDGKPCPILVEAPAVYTEFKEASYDVLAKQILNGISDHFGADAHSQLGGVSADCPYQAHGFKEYLRQSLGWNDDDDIALPMPWDTAHLLNLAVTDVRDSNNKSGSFFREFIKRCNIFNHVLAHGKGFAFLEMVDKNARRPVFYATQRFASSSFEQWVKIEKSFESLWKAFDQLHPNRSEEEEWQYMIGGSDFVCDLLALLDILQPVVELILSAESLDTPIWKLKQWWPKVESQLNRAADGDPEFFQRMNKVKPDLHPEGVFK